METSKQVHTQSNNTCTTVETHKKDVKYVSN